ncbi:YihA family ribosome biogenesis GTP-binding protein [Alicyclobacillus sp. TC]|uniref:ribosome biogenesis GTP-binding protein YihA/YsxC n=1 Tax=Alicyclobacillus sp. TC TaxID=2606450 RepID=UPI0019345746|nr:ribosome biogenesis GTP-binding protein YihA/YsxC [Alicyclobacillus sp. TC]QRF23195.1 YihA family ribosome biogenesis GTP-binding protein [Alicyclobacillus sp. TC]
MKIRKVQFEISAVRPEQWPQDGLPEFAFIGRSNVGKSSLLNRLLNRKSLARVSQHPGKTQQINFYNINDTLRFADLPGYGYAQVSKTQRAAFRKWIVQYLEKREPITRVLHLVDIRHEPSVDDRDFHRLLLELQHPVLVVATKLDKISKRDIAKHIQQIRTGLQTPNPILSISSEKNMYIDELWSVLETDLTAHESELSDNE